MSGDGNDNDKLELSASLSLVVNSAVSLNLVMNSESLRISSNSVVGSKLAVKPRPELSYCHYHNPELELHYSAPPDVQSSENTHLLNETQRP